MFKDKDLVIIKPEFLSAQETGEEVYIVLGDESDFGSVKIAPTWDTGLRYPPINTIRSECITLKGN
jgi:hypothetical protein